MGSSSWSKDAYSTLKKDYSTKATADIFTSKSKVSAILDPKGLKFRESRDSDAHPKSLAVSIWLDVTGSMSDIPVYLIKNKLNIVLETLIDKGFKDAQVMFGAIGDHECDRWPLQVGQFECGTPELVKSLADINLEKGGGGNAGESYLLSWLVAGRYTSIDCFEKRGEKGILFTIGDEPCLMEVPGKKIQELLGLSECPADVTAKQLFEEASRLYHIYHIDINHGYRSSDYIIGSWKELIGENLILCDDKDLIPELIATTVGMINGIDISRMTSSFDSSTKHAVSTALATIQSSITKSANTGIVKL